MISKSLFVDFCAFKKLAWWKVNKRDTYRFIKGIEEDEQVEKIIELGQTVEDAVGQYFLSTEGMKRSDVFSDNPDADGDDSSSLLIEYKNKFESNMSRTLQAVRDKKHLIYQAGFQYGELFARVDYLKLNDKGLYDIIEVKAKTGVRKSPSFKEHKNKNLGELEPEFESDISFQKYVVTKVFEKEQLGEIGNTYFAYLNSSYRKQGDIRIDKLIVLDEVGTPRHVVHLSGEGETKKVLLKNKTRDFESIEAIVQEMNEVLSLPEKTFNERYPFDGSKYVPYFGKERPFGTIYGRGIQYSPSKIKQLHTERINELSELTGEQVEDFYSSKEGSVNADYGFIKNYLRCLETGDDIIEREKIREELKAMDDKVLCFYDYESLSVPIPLLDNTGPYQQAVVQYSLHKVYPNGQVKHFGGILENISSNKSVSILDIPENPNLCPFEQEKIISGGYKDVYEEFIADIGEDINNSCFIVWYKGFENSRNTEIGETFSDFLNITTQINEQTYDLRDIFTKAYYFSNRFKGSTSIKYVLPALVGHMTYEGMNVPNGMKAMEYLNDLLTNTISLDKKEMLLKDLLVYCGQDSLAMYEIYKKLSKVLE